MWKLNSPDVENALGDLRTALTYVDGTPKFPITNDDTARITALYLQYDQALGRPHQEFVEGGIREDLRNALYEAYGEVQKKRRLESLRSTLMAVARRCPLCGIGPVTDLDHHLARSTFKPLSIYPRNLVPACGACNNAKRAVGDLDGNEFLHAYLSELPDLQFLHATCKMQSGALMVQFSIVQPAGLSNETFTKLAYQFERLRLNERYQPEINIFLCGHAVSLQDLYGHNHDAAGVADWARRSARSMEGAFGRNDWRPVLLNAIADCGEFCGGGFLSALGQAEAVTI